LQHCNCHAKSTVISETEEIQQGHYFCQKPAIHSRKRNPHLLLYPVSVNTIFPFEPKNIEQSQIDRFL